MIGNRVKCVAYYCRNASGHFHRISPILVWDRRSVKQHHNGRQNYRFELSKEPLVSFGFFVRALPDFAVVVEHIFVQLVVVIHMDTVV